MFHKASQASLFLMLGILKSAKCQRSEGIQLMIKQSVWIGSMDSPMNGREVDLHISIINYFSRLDSTILHSYEGIKMWCCIQNELMMWCYIKNMYKFRILIHVSLTFQCRIFSLSCSLTKLLPIKNFSNTRVYFKINVSESQGSCPIPKSAKSSKV